MLRILGIVSVCVLMFGVTSNSYGQTATLRGPTAAYINELEDHAKDVVDLCQYAETKFERKYCYNQSVRISINTFFDHLNSKIQDQILDIKNKYKDEFVKKKVKKT